MKFLSNWTNKPESEVLCNNICFFSTANARCRQPSFLLLGHKLTRLGANLSGREIGWIGKADAEGWWQPLNILHHQLALVVGPGGPDVPAHFSPPGLQKGGFGRMAAVQFSVQLLAHFHGIATRLPPNRPIYTFVGRNDLPQSGERVIKYSAVERLCTRREVSPSSPNIISMRIRFAAEMKTLLIDFGIWSSFLTLLFSISALPWDLPVEAFQSDKIPILIRYAVWVASSWEGIWHWQSQT